MLLGMLLIDEFFLYGPNKNIQLKIQHNETSNNLKEKFK